MAHGYGNPNGGYGNQNRAAYDAMMGMGDMEEMPAEQGGSFGSGIPEGSYDRMPQVANDGDMNIGQEGQDTPPGMYPDEQRRRPTRGY